jgi:anthranilate phosphoribosyltransferase
MQDAMKDALIKLQRGGTLSEPEAQAVFGAMMGGQADVGAMGALLALLAVREPTVDELTGAARVMRQHVTAISTRHGLENMENVIDTCGTGGTGSTFFNISTTAAIVAAACGVPVAKHGNRSVTSRSGSSDVLQALGVNIETTVEQEAECLRRAGICFAFAPRHHPAMKHVAALRQTLGFPTIFNLLGPLTNPAGVKRQLMGTRTASLAGKLLEVLVRLGAERAMVVCGQDRQGSMCDISVTGPTHVASYDGVTVKTYTLRVADLGLKEYADGAGMVVASPAASGELVRRVLGGEKGVARDVVLANAAGALWVGGAAGSLREGVVTAAEAIDSGAARGVLARLVEASRK